VGSAGRLREYHERTKHSFESIRTGGHYLDWDNEPSRFKEYPDLQAQPLPPFRTSTIPAHQAVTGSARPDGDAPVDLEVLSHLLYHTGGVSRTRRTPMGEFHYRTYASAGALYPIEVYVVVGDVAGLEPGVYHYAPNGHGLHSLRPGEYRGDLGLAGAAPGAACVLLSGIPWRTAWKYTARGFRHLYWDGGMALANLLAAAAARRVAARVLLGFVDAAPERLLGLDGRTEFVLCAVAIGRGPEVPPTGVEPLSLRVAPLSPRPGSDREIEGAREALRLRTEDEVESFRQGKPRSSGELSPGAGIESLSERHVSNDPFEVVVRRRGSSRRLSGAGFPAAEYGAILDRALAGLPGDWRAQVPRAFVSAHALKGLAPGAYEYRREGSFRPIVEGVPPESLRAQAGHLCLDQRLGAEAAATTFLMADLDRALDTLGGRGYAAVQLEAAVAGGRIYLGGYAQCLGASGITFYDDEVRAFFRTAAEPMVAMVLGQEGRRRDLIRCRQAKEGA
jgi:SagB-type dehydrogenase family enzyme